MAKSVKMQAILVAGVALVSGCKLEVLAPAGDVAAQQRDLLVISTGLMLLIILPVTLVAVWLMQLIPAYFRLALESRVNRWYGELKFIENDLSQEVISGLDLTRYLSRLNGIDNTLLAFSCPKDLMARCYMLHQHIEFVRQRLYRMRGR